MRRRILRWFFGEPQRRSLMVVVEYEQIERTARFERTTMAGQYELLRDVLGGAIFKARRLGVS